jgi:carboxypeptidase Q
MATMKLIFNFYFTIIFSYLFLHSCKTPVYSSLKFLTKEFDELSDAYSLIIEHLNQTISYNPIFKHHAYDQTAFLVDTFGPRLIGSKNLEYALEHMKNLLMSEGFENVKLEKVEFQKKWVRGEEHMILYSPRPVPTKVPMIGLGKSVGGNITAEVVMVRNFEELEEKGKNGELENKIVFINMKWINYGETVQSRTKGALLAAKYRGVGCVIRSVASKSIENPHTGTVYYDENYPKIPAAAVSLETADMLDRMITRGQKVVLNLYMEAHFEEGLFASHNVMGEITGTNHKEEIILLGGHIDSWDVGPQTGANDDAAGFMVCFEAVRMLVKLGLRPKRTIRFIAWTGEEQGDGDTNGASAYVRMHEDEMENHLVAFESDSGTTDIYGFGYSGGRKGFNLLKIISTMYLKDIGASTLSKNDGVMADTHLMHDKYNIPVMRNLIKDTPDSEYYFTYHHSSGDSMNVLNPDDMDRNVAAIASMFYLIAEVPWRLPRD